jgi:cation transport regulator ChaC
MEAIAAKAGMAVGIMAYGSLVDEPGVGLDAVTIRRISLKTPFLVEFARSSATRDGAPTLIPVREGGALIPAWLLVLDESVTLAGARALLYRRETHRDDASVPAQVDWIHGLPHFWGTSVCLYAALAANIPPPLTGEKLAELAVASATAPSGADKRDGISYLAQQKHRRIRTPLMASYAQAVLARTSARDLDEAWRRARSGDFAS